MGLKMIWPRVFFIRLTLFDHAFYRARPELVEGFKRFILQQVQNERDEDLNSEIINEEKEPYETNDIS